MPDSSARIIIDTNLWISFLIANDYSKLTPLLLSGQVTLIFSNELLLEITTVTQKPKLQKYFLQSDIDLLIRLFIKYAEFIRVTTKIEICRDVKDDFLLSLAVDGKADYLITGDNDLLILKSHGNTKILAISDFLKVFTT